MKNCKLILIFLAMVSQGMFASTNTIDSDTIKTSKGDLIIYFVGHGTLYFKFNNHIIHVDPVSRYADYSTLPKADIILVTHQHGDHYDTAAIQSILKPRTDFIYTKACSESANLGGRVVKNGDSVLVDDIKIESVPAYNIEHKRDNGNPFHPKGEGNGYVLTFGDKRIYIAGDTENIPEMASLKNVDIAFLPMNLPYTMTPEMVVNAAEMIKPRILYPYHYGNTNTDELLKLLENKKLCEVRIRQMQ
jgi:L-ascorbate metabolism protein UlaG (beta-lactamase superfamily)